MLHERDAMPGFEGWLKSTTQKRQEGYCRQKLSATEKWKEVDSSCGGERGRGERRWQGQLVARL